MAGARDPSIQRLVSKYYQDKIFADIQGFINDKNAETERILK